MKQDAPASVGTDRGLGSCLPLTRRSTMSNSSLPDTPTPVKPESVGAVLGRIVDTIAANDREAHAAVVSASRRIEGRD